MLECADASHGLNGHVMSDGGCTNPGDVAKAFGAGADFVMIGGARIFFFHHVALNTYIYAEKASRVPLKRCYLRNYMSIWSLFYL